MFSINLVILAVYSINSINYSVVRCS